MAVNVPVRVSPGSKRNEVVGFGGGVWRVKVSAPPVKGKANQELITFLGEVLGVSRSSLSIVRGHTARNKVISVEGLTRAEITERLTAAD